MLFAIRPTLFGSSTETMPVQARVSGSSLQSTVQVEGTGRPLVLRWPKREHPDVVVQETVNGTVFNQDLVLTALPNINL